MSSLDSGDHSLIYSIYSNITTRANPMFRKIFGMMMDFTIFYGMFKMFSNGGFINFYYRYYVL